MTKRDDKLEAFRVSDVRRPQVRSGQPVSKGTTETAAPALSAGFPGIESRLEQGTIDSVVDEIRVSYAKLEGLATSKNVKERAAAKKAMAGYELVADLFEYLFATKESIGK